MNYTEIAVKKGANVYMEDNGYPAYWEFSVEELTAYSKEIERLALERAVERCTSTVGKMSIALLIEELEE